MRQNQLFGQDLQNLQAHQNALAGMGPEAAAAANAPIPNLRSMQMQQMMAPGMLQSLLPMNPLQQAHITMRGLIQKHAKLAFYRRHNN
jgi:hypothetical protein